MESEPVSAARSKNKRPNVDAGQIRSGNGHYSLEPDNEATMRAPNASIAYKPLWLDDLRAVVRDLLDSSE